jgi:hypothetical protein
MWRTFSVFSKTTKSLMLAASIAISAQAVLGSPTRRALKAGSTQVREALSEAELAKLVTRDSMIGVMDALPAVPPS